MNIVVIGSGGREHAIAWKLAGEPDTDTVFAIPGNAGMTRDGIECVEVPDSELESFCKTNNIGLVVVGPEAPLCAGIVDRLTEAGVTAFGPKKRAAALEGSKAFAKQVMDAAGIPTAAFALFSELDAAIDYVQTVDHAIVIKADGLAGGKGVVLPATAQEAVETLTAFMKEKKFGDASADVVIEERLAGPELSFMVITDGAHFTTLPTSRDFKRLMDDDQGPNTGGMGAVSPAPGVTAETIDACESIVSRLLAQMERDHGGFRGFLYVGLMLTPEGPKVLEFNVRLGDPETQALMVALGQRPIAGHLAAAARGELTENQRWVGTPTACVVLASEGYPEKPCVGRPIKHPALSCKVFYAGVRSDGDELQSSGGRVLSVVAADEDLDRALGRVYADMSEISLDGGHYRRDIG